MRLINDAITLYAQRKFIQESIKWRTFNIDSNMELLSIAIFLPFLSPAVAFSFLRIKMKPQYSNIQVWMEQCVYFYTEKYTRNDKIWIRFNLFLIKLSEPFIAQNFFVSHSLPIMWLCFQKSQILRKVIFEEEKSINLRPENGWNFFNDSVNNTKMPRIETTQAIFLQSKLLQFAHWIRFELNPNSNRSIQCSICLSSLIWLSQ